jgi:hypothetical protein
MSGRAEVKTVKNPRTMTGTFQFYTVQASTPGILSKFSAKFNVKFIKLVHNGFYKCGSTFSVTLQRFSHSIILETTTRKGVIIK